MKNKSTELWKFIVSTQRITCDNCANDDLVRKADEIEASDYFYKEGWRATNDILPRINSWVSSKGKDF